MDGGKFKVIEHIYQGRDSVDLYKNTQKRITILLKTSKITW